MTGFDLRVTGFEPRVTGFDPRVTGFDACVTGFDPCVTGFDPRVTDFDPRVTFIVYFELNFFFNSCRSPAEHLFRMLRLRACTAKYVFAYCLYGHYSQGFLFEVCPPWWPSG